MGQNLANKILQAHLVEGELVPGKEIAIKVDQTLLQDATGTMAMLEFLATGIDRIKVSLAAQYIDHNLLQTDNKNADDHAFLTSAAQRLGVYLSKPGNGVSHQVHLERFGVPGTTMLGADSHTPTAAGLGMLAIGVGGLDAALAMAGRPFHLTCPKIWGIKLTGELQPWVSGKDVILEMLRRHSVKGGVGKIIEYYGPGVATLSATDRATIGNMGAELGATTTVFPSDHRTREFLEAQGRGEVWRELSADPDATYDEYDEIDLSQVEPLIACPTSPDNVVRVADIEGLKVDQVIVGSSVNSSFRDLMTVCKILDGRKVAPSLSFHINPGSRQVLENVVANGGFIMLLLAGAQIHQPGCLGCIGMGQAPGTNQVSFRTFPRNFPGRSGTKDDRVYLCSPETAAAAGLFGVATDPRKLGELMPWPAVQNPDRYLVDDSAGILAPPEDGSRVEIVTGPNIVPLPEFDALPDELEVEVIIKVGDNISTDTIMPAGNKVLPFRSNIPAISKFVFEQADPEFSERAKAKGNGAVVGGVNYGQGSSREHAALAPRFLGIRVKIAKGFARIHRSNLINYGILPLTFKDPADYDSLNQGDRLKFARLRELVESGATEIPVEVNGREIVTLLDASDRERRELLAGGLLNVVKEESHGR
ncbi:aconitate hydratase [Geomonas sp. Red32]|uniref:aconitate hydratase n=1 Tax=Geomonas sp. Red32 TaxID=2912856 RepID=UPI00202CBA85|nr:aconitate hydratase [Geomonas sp. Red32]MCM0081567.1 aconitate hydratase [Geomonas sp. Red32]